MSWNYGPEIIEYHDRKIVVDSNEYRLVDFIAANISRLSEVDLVAIDTLMRGEETSICGMRIRRVV